MDGEKNVTSPKGEGTKGTEPPPEGTGTKGTEPPPEGTGTKGTEPPPEGTKGTEPPPEGTGTKGTEPPPEGTELPPEGTGTEPPPEGTEPPPEGTGTEGTEPPPEGTGTEGTEPPPEGTGTEPDKGVLPKGQGQGTKETETGKAKEMLLAPTVTSSRFVIYLLSGSLFVAVMYVLYHSKSKISGLCQKNGPRRTKRPNVSEYQQLDQNLSDIITSLQKKNID
ncbi:MAGE-like protein 2 isoform X2 [Stegostoma tigrinum]|nr:MAGE-like protein 2 isoform X2 [Stegostoma tigrinum]